MDIIFFFELSLMQSKVTQTTVIEYYYSAQCMFAPTDTKNELQMVTSLFATLQHLIMPQTNQLLAELPHYNYYGSSVEAGNMGNFATNDLLEYLRLKRGPFNKVHNTTWCG